MTRGRGAVEGAAEGGEEEVDRVHVTLGNGSRGEGDDAARAGPAEALGEAVRVPEEDERRVAAREERREVGGRRARGEEGGEVGAREVERLVRDGAASEEVRLRAAADERGEARPRPRRAPEEPQGR
jgi:hypothetical protein